MKMFNFYIFYELFHHITRHIFWIAIIFLGGYFIFHQWIVATSLAIIGGLAFGVFFLFRHFRVIFWILLISYIAWVFM